MICDGQGMRSRPAILVPILLLVAGCGAVPDSSAPKRVRSEAAAPGLSQARPEARQCHAELGKTGSRFAPLPDRYFGAGCSALNSVQLDGIGGDETSW